MAELVLSPVNAAGLTATPHTASDFIIGPDDLDVNTGAAHSDNDAAPVHYLWVDSVHRRIQGRSLLLTEVGDPPEVGLRRTGGTHPDGPVAATVATETLGLLHWTGWCSDSDNFQSRSAQIYARAVENITSTAAGGSLHFGTTTAGTAAGCTDRMVIREDGRVDVLTGPLRLSEIADPAAPETNTGSLYVRDNGAGKSQLCIRFPTGAVQVLATEP